MLLVNSNSYAHGKGAAPRNEQTLEGDFKNAEKRNVQFMDWEPWVYTGERFKISHSAGWYPLPPPIFYVLPRMVKHGNIYLFIDSHLRVMT